MARMTNAQKQANYRVRFKRRKEQAAMISDLLTDAVRDASVEVEDGGLRVTVSYDGAIYREFAVRCAEAGVDADQVVDAHIKRSTTAIIEKEQRVTIST